MTARKISDNDSILLPVLRDGAYKRKPFLLKPRYQTRATSTSPGFQKRTSRPVTPRESSKDRPFLLSFRVSNISNASNSPPGYPLHNGVPDAIHCPEMVPGHTEETFLYYTPPQNHSHCQSWSPPLFLPKFQPLSREEVDVENTTDKENPETTPMELFLPSLP